MIRKATENTSDKERESYGETIRGFFDARVGISSGNYNIIIITHVYITLSLSVSVSLSLSLYIYIL